MIYKKNDKLTVKIDELGINGEGVAKSVTPTLFAPFALPGEEVEVKIILIKKQFMIGKLVKIVNINKHRVEAPCPVFTKCGGCQLQHLQYDEQLNFKTNLVKNTLIKVSNINADVNCCIASEKEYNYRNKISMPVRNVNSQLKIGFFASGSHRVVEVEHCPLQQRLTNKVITIFKNFMIKFDIPAYNEELKTGLVKHLVAREFENKLLVTVVINGSVLPHLNKLDALLKKEFEDVSLYINENHLHNNVILGNQSVFISGQEKLSENLSGITVKTGVHSFMQVNNDIRDLIYNKVIEKINTFNPSVIIDAYSGAGLLTGILAKNNKEAKVYGLEIEPEAIQAANDMLEENNLQNKVTNILGDCTKTLPKLIKKIEGKTSLVLDPPRKGVDKKVIEAILKTKPDQIIYVACGLSSLARDLAYLTNAKNLKDNKFIKESNPIYKIKNIIPYDMFPQTKHVETLVELIKIN